MVKVAFSKEQRTLSLLSSFGYRFNYMSIFLAGPGEIDVLDAVVAVVVGKLGEVDDDCHSV